MSTELVFTVNKGDKHATAQKALSMVWSSLDGNRSQKSHQRQLTTYRLVESETCTQGQTGETGEYTSQNSEGDAR